MARIEWAQLCELAFLDDCDRLCMIGIMTRFPVPSLPIAMRQLMIVARIVDVHGGDSVRVAASLVTPSGLSIAVHQTDGFDVAVAAEYLLITLRDVPVSEEGVHRLVLTIGEGAPVTLDIPVRLGVKAQTGRQTGESHGLALNVPAWVPRRQVN
jgi:hypothetical protein